MKKKRREVDTILVHPFRRAPDMLARLRTMQMVINQQVQIKLLEKAT